MAESPESPWRRDDWYGSPETDADSDAGTGEPNATGVTWTGRSRREEKAAHIAHQLLRGVAPALCAQTCADPDRAPVELGEPEHYPGSTGERGHTRAVRANESDGYLSGGESTAVVLDGTPTERFLAVVEAWLDHCEQEGLIGAALRETLYRDAQSLKQGTDTRDEAIVTLLYDTGLRRGELAQVDREMLDLDAGELRTPPRIQKDYPTNDRPQPRDTSDIT